MTVSPHGLIAAAAGLSLSLAEALELAENPPAGWSDRRVRRLRRWATAYEAHERALQRERYLRATDDMSARSRELADAAQAAEELAEDYERDVRLGRLSADEARDKLAPLVRTIRELRQRTQQVDSSESAAFEAVGAEPADAQQVRNRRFPTLAQRLPVLTGGWLDGDGPPEFGPQR